VSYTKDIPAGGEGTITIKLNTTGYGDRTMSKYAQVFTNDPTKKEIHLTVNVPVESFAKITPSMVRFNGRVGAPLKQEVRIFPTERHPFKITGTRTREGRFVRVTLTEIVESEQPGYLLEVENIRADVGAYNDMIYLETNNKEKPALEIRVYANIYDPSLNQDKKPGPAATARPSVPPTDPLPVPTPVPAR
jgi:hypothetical protein